MKFFKLLLACFFILLFDSTSYAFDEGTFKQKVASNFDKLIAISRVQEPFHETVTRSPKGSKLYRNASNGIVLVGTANDMVGSGVVISYRGLVITNWHVWANYQIMS